MPHAFITSLPIFPPHPLSATLSHPTTPPRPSCLRQHTPLRRPAPRMASTPFTPPPSPSPPQSPPSAPSPLPILALVSLASVSLYSISAHLPSLSSLLPRFTAYLSALPPLPASLFLFTLNFFTVLLCFPANMALMIAAGAILPAPLAFISLFSSKLLASCVAFYLARGVLYHRVTRLLLSYPRIARLWEAMGKEGGWKFVLLMRLSPFPGFVLNYLLSLTAVRFTEYAWATGIGIMPSITNLVLMGAAAKGVVAGGATNDLFGTIVRVVCAASTVLMMVYGGRIAKKAFGEMEEAALQETERGHVLDVDHKPVAVAGAGEEGVR